MGVARLYMPGEIPNKINKIIRQINLVTESDNIVAMLGSRSLWTIGPSVIATDKDIIYFNNSKGMLAKTKRFTYKSIGSIRLENKGISTIIIIGLSGAGEEELDVIAPANEIKEFYQIICENQEVAGKISTLQATQNLDITDQIKKLAELRDSDILTEEEFTTKKKQLLGI